MYLEIMGTVRDRFDVVRNLRAATGSDFARAETAAFHGRKIVEGIAFGCLVATENGLKHVPRDAKGQWNAENILTNLEKKKIETLPSPSLIRRATDDEKDRDGVKVVVEGIVGSRISHVELIAIYRRLHPWLHERNPYTGQDRVEFYSSNGQKLWDDLALVERFVERHFISIAGHGFYCVLRDTVDGLTKVQPLSRP